MRDTDPMTQTGLGKLAVVSAIPDVLGEQLRLWVKCQSSLKLRTPAQRGAAQKTSVPGWAKPIQLSA